MTTRYYDNMSRDEFKSSLYKWLKDKGILSELQAFLRQQMVLKVNGSNFHARNVSPQSPNDLAFTLLVCEYLKRQNLTFTLSVLAAERGLPTQAAPTFDDKLLTEILHCLKLGNLMEHKNDLLRKNETLSLLESIFSEFEDSRQPVSLVTLQNVSKKTSKQAGNQFPESQKNTANTATQTENEAETEFPEEFYKREVEKLKRQLKESQAELEKCRLQLDNTRKNVSKLASTTLQDQNVMTKNQGQNFDFSHKPLLAEFRPSSSKLLEKTQRSRSFLLSLDEQVSSLNERCRNVASNSSPSKVVSQMPAELTFTPSFINYEDLFMSSAKFLSADFLTKKES